MRTIIIDDVEINRRALKEIITGDLRQLTVVGEASSMKTGIEEIKNKRPELIILDIELGDGTGFDILKKLDTTDFKVIFLTAYENFALDAFRFNAVDYLLKPVSIVELKAAVNKLIGQTINTKSQQDIPDNLSKPDHPISITTTGGFENISFSSLIRCKADGGYTECYVSNSKRIVSSKNLKEFEKLLSDFNFVRVHHSHLININQIKSYDRYDLTVTMLNGDIVPISQRKRKHFLDQINLV